MNINLGSSAALTNKNNHWFTYGSVVCVLCFCCLHFFLESSTIKKKNKKNGIDDEAKMYEFISFYEHDFLIIVTKLQWDLEIVQFLMFQSKYFMWFDLNKLMKI